MWVECRHRPPRRRLLFATLNAAVFPPAFGFRHAGGQGSLVAFGREFNLVTHFRDVHAADETVGLVCQQPFFQPGGQMFLVREGNDVRVNQAAHLKGWW
jgi:hypothetical protein